MITAAAGGATALYHNGNPKIATASGGVSVTGTAFVTDGIQDTGQGGSATIFNESGSTADFRVESDGNTHMLFVDGGTNRVGIGRAAPQSPFEVHIETNKNIGFSGGQSELGSIPSLVAYQDNGSLVDIGFRGTTVRFATASAERMRILANGDIALGNTVVNPASGFASQRGFGYDNDTGIVEIATTANAQVLVLGKNQGTDGTLVEFRKQSNVVGSIGTQGGDLNIGTAACGIAFIDGVPAIYPFSTNGAGSTRDAAIDLGDSGARFKDLYLSGGVFIGGTGAANKLDDYEEGTWTPTSIAGVSLTVNAAVYTKIGRVVHIGMAVVFASNTNSAAVQITGLPFAVRNQNDQAYGATIANTDVGRENIFFSFLRNTSHIGIGNSSNSDVANSVYSGKKLCLSGFYFTDA